MIDGSVPLSDQIPIDPNKPALATRIPCDP
jgi:hypothetical protein